MNDLEVLRCKDCKHFGEFVEMCSCSKTSDCDHELHLCMYFKPENTILVTQEDRGCSLMGFEECFELREVAG